MMQSNFLNKNFYSVSGDKSVGETKEKFSVSVLLNPEHEVYKGHFPGMPVAPGVCLIGMIQEILEKKFGKQLFLSEAFEIKFMKPVLPDEKNDFEVNYEIKFLSEQIIESKVTLMSGDQLYMKMRCNYKSTYLPD